MFKTDRVRVKKKSNRGRDSGGVCAYIRDDLAGLTEIILSYSNGVVEVLTVHSKKMNLVVCVLYRQPNDSVHGHQSKNLEFKDALDKLSQCLIDLGTPTPDIIMGGDFNLPHTQWPHCSSRSGCPRAEKEMIETLKNFSNQFCMMQIVDLPTHKDGNVLDCVFINNENIMNDININVVLQSISHHKIIEVSTPLHTNQRVNDVSITQKTGFYALNFFHSDVQWENILNDLQCIDWKSVLHNKNASDMLDVFYDTCLNICQRYVPSKLPTSKRVNKVVRFRRALCRRRRRVNKLLLRVSSPSRKEKLSNEIIDIETKLMNSYKDEKSYEEKKAIDAIKKNPKYFFKYARRFSKTKSSIGPLVNEHGEVINDSFAMANMLMEQYSKMFSTPLDVDLDIDQVDQSNALFDILFDQNDFIKAIDKLKTNAAPGLDGFPAALLKHCKTALSIPLTIMWKSSLIEGIVPDKLKHSPITPLHKGGSRAICQNYRPVALTSHIIKLFEKIMKQRIVEFLEANALFNPGQHGFRRGRSCLSELLVHFDEILEGLTNSSNVDVIYLDFAKAFDKVDFKVLLKKLHKIGVRGKLLKWIESFLTNRTLYVVVNGVMSLPCFVLSGVAQGSVLGPLLFLIMMIDIDSTITDVSIKSFADDTRVLKSVSGPSDTAIMEESLNLIYQWAADNNLSFNDSKFEFIQYGCNKDLQLSTDYKSSAGVQIEKKEGVSDLGVYMSQDASFKSHIDNICASAQRTVSWICRTFRSRSALSMLTTWKSLVRPKLEYCSQLWSPSAKSDIQKLELVQRDFVRKIKVNSHLNYWETLKHLHLYSLERRRERYRIIYTWKIIEHLVPNISFTDQRKVNVHYTTRFGRKCVIPPLGRASRFSTLYEHSMAVHGPKLFNAMPQHIRDLSCCSVDTFKYNLDTFLCTIPDQPVIPGYTMGNNQLYGSNSLVDILS